jgi:hypothetical protein
MIVTYCLLPIAVDDVVAGLLGVIGNVTFSLARHFDVVW